MKIELMEDNILDRSVLEIGSPDPRHTEKVSTMQEPISIEPFWPTV